MPRMRGFLHNWMILRDCMLSDVTPGYVASMESHPALKELQTSGTIRIDTLLLSEYRGLVGREVRGHSANHRSIKDQSPYLHLKRHQIRSRCTGYAATGC